VNFEEAAAGVEKYIYKRLRARSWVCLLGAGGKKYLSYIFLSFL